VFFFRDFDEKRQLESPKRKWFHNVYVYLKAVTWKAKDWIHVVQDTKK
jgi:hypothetical protein